MKLRSTLAPANLEDFEESRLNADDMKERSEMATITDFGRLDECASACSTGTGIIIEKNAMKNNFESHVSSLACDMFSVAGTSCYFYPHLGLKSKRWTEITEKADDDNGAGVYVMQCSPALEIITPSFEPRFEFDDILHICCKKKLNHLIEVKHIFIELID